jgi:hypothetical protein
MADESKARSNESAQPAKTRKTRRPKAKHMAAKRKTSKSMKPATPQKQSASDFIRAQPRATPAADIVEKAKAAGFKFKAGYVYTVRGNARKAGSTKSGAGRRSSGGAGRRGKAPEMRERVLDLMAQHSDWTTAQIARRAGCSPTYAYAVARGAGAGGARNAKGATGRSPSTDGDRAAFYRFLKRQGVEEVQRLVTEYAFIQSA